MLLWLLVLLLKKQLTELMWDSSVTVTSTMKIAFSVDMSALLEPKIFQDFNLGPSISEAYAELFDCNPRKTSKTTNLTILLRLISKKKM